MKLKNLLLFVFFILMSSVISAQTSVINDANFELYLENHDANGNYVGPNSPNNMGNNIVGDNLVLTSRINTVTKLEINGKSGFYKIDDFTGIDKFTSLQTFIVSNHSFSSINLSGNTQLIILEIINSNVTTLDITNNVLLTRLNMSGHILSTIDLTKNVLLTDLNLSVLPDRLNTNFKSIDLSKNIKLTNLNLHNAFINYLDVSQNTLLTDLNLGMTLGIESDAINSNSNFQSQPDHLDLSNNVLLENLIIRSRLYFSINLSKNIALKKLEATFLYYVYYLDLSNNVNLEEAVLNYNYYRGVNLKNGTNSKIVKLDLGNSIGNTLSCLEVDDVSYSTTNWVGVNYTIPNDITFSTDCNTTVIESYYPHFENYLETHNAAGDVVNLGDPTSMGNGIANDKKVFTSRISGVTSLDVSDINIINLGGIQDFTSLIILNISNTGINRVDLSKSTELNTLTCIGNNDLKTLDLSKNTKLTWLNAYGNSNLTNLNVSNCPLLHVLYAYNNKLSTIDISNNNELAILSLNSNELTNLDLHSNTKLIQVYAQSNQLTSLDISNNKKVNVLRADANQLTYLNLKNQNRNNFSSMKVDQNPSLTCIEVDNVAFWNSATAPDTIDAGAVVGIGDGTSMGNGIANDNFVTTSRVSSVTNLDVSGLSITSLTGIKSFTALQTLNASNNLLTEIDVKNNLSLSDLNLSTNQLQSIDLNRNVNLTSIQLQNNSFKSLHFIKNKALTALNVSNNQLITLNVKNENNAIITSFNALNNPNLLCVLVDNTTYSDLNWTQKDETSSYNSDSCDATLTYVPDTEFEKYLETNGLGNNIANDHYVETSKLAPVINLIINDLHIQDLTGIEKFPNLKILLVSGNQLNSIDLSKNTALTHLFAHDNQLTSLDVSKNTILTQLVASDNQLTSLDVSQNPALSVLVLQNNQLTSLDVRNGNNVLLSNFNATTNTNLLCIEVDDVSYSTANWTDIDGASSFSTNCAKSWSGAVDANWQNASNWISGSVPTSNSIVTILNQGNPPIISSVVTINDLNINAGATTTIAVGKSLTVNGNFINNGNLIVNSTTTNSGTLIVKGTSTGNVTYKRGGLLANKWSVISAPVANQKVKDFATNVSNDIRKNNDAVKKICHCKV